jgi:DNA-binding response OmpR family regulator
MAGELILVVEDDTSIAAGLALNLKVEGYAVEVANDGHTGLAKINALRPALVILDLSLPRLNGLEIIADMRGRGDRTPILILSARDAEPDVVGALRLGADDYVTKPFGLAELMARAAAVLRRAGDGGPSSTSATLPVSSPSAGRLVFGDVVVDLDTRQVTARGREVKMTKLEFDLLAYLVNNAGRVLSREQLLRAVWDVNGLSPRTVDNFVAQLRAKLEVDAERPRHLVTVRGAGYRFDV